MGRKDKSSWTKTKSFITTTAITILRRLVPASTLPFLSSYMVDMFDILDIPEQTVEVNSFFPERSKVRKRPLEDYKRKFPFAVPLNSSADEEERLYLNSLPNLNTIPVDIIVNDKKQIRRPDTAELKEQSLDCIRAASLTQGNMGRLVYSSRLKIDSASSLTFDSNFESGNLEMAVKVTDTLYHLYTKTDVNSPFGRHNQWFYFSVSGFERLKEYQFTIVNMSKNNSQFNFGTFAGSTNIRRHATCSLLPVSGSLGSNRK